MSRKEFNLLPSKRRMLTVVFICILGYAFLESVGGFEFFSLPESTRKMLGRAGMVIGYLSALAAGLSFHWEAKAQGIAAYAEATMRQNEGTMDLLQSLSMELDRSFDAELARCKQQIDAAKADLQETNQYLSTKAWFGWFALGGVVIGTLFQLIGAT